MNRMKERIDHELARAWEPYNRRVEAFSKANPSAQGLDMVLHAIRGTYRSKLIERLREWERKMKTSERVSRLELAAIKRSQDEFQQAVLDALAEVSPEMRNQILLKLQEKRTAICGSGAEK